MCFTYDFFFPQNQRIITVGKDLQDLQVSCQANTKMPTKPCPKVQYLHILEHLQRRSLHHPPEQPVEEPDHSCSKEFFLNIQLKSPQFNTESKDHVIPACWSLEGIFSPTPLQRQCHPQQVTQGYNVWVVLESLQERRLHDFSRQPTLGLWHPYSKEFFLPQLQFASVALCPVTGHN